MEIVDVKNRHQFCWFDLQPAQGAKDLWRRHNKFLIESDKAQEALWGLLPFNKRAVREKLDCFGPELHQWQRYSLMMKESIQPPWITLRFSFLRLDLHRHKEVMKEDDAVGENIMKFWWFKEQRIVKPRIGGMQDFPEAWKQTQVWDSSIYSFVAPRIGSQRTAF